MIKIIKHGTRDTRECDKCGCLFSFDKEDISFVPRGIESCINCPQCGKKIVLEAIRTIQPIKSEKKCIDCKYWPSEYDIIPCVKCHDGNLWEAKEIPDNANCSNCEHVNDTDYREKCNECGSENFFKYWKGKNKK